MKPSFKSWLILAGVLILIAGAGAYLTLRRAGVARIGGAEPARRPHRTAGIAGKMAASRAVLSYLREPGAEKLEAALRACLSTAEREPGDLLNNFLLAFCYRELKDTAAEARALAECRPEERAMYRFSFYDHRDDLADALYYMPAYLCGKLREAHNAWETFPPGSRCPFFGGPITIREYRRGDGTGTRFICPKCDGMIQLRENAFMGNIVNSRVKKENPLISILPHIAVLLEDRQWGGTDKADAVPRLVSALGIKEGMTIADIGAGIGQFAFRFAEAAGPKGKVYAEDIDEGLIGLVRYCVEKEGLKNIVPVVGTPTDMKLPPGALDMAVLIHVYQSIVLFMDEQGPGVMEPFFDGFFASIRKSLKKEGVLIVVDHIDPQRDVSAATVAAALEKRGFRLKADKGEWKGRDYILVFGKAGPPGK